MGTKAHAGRVFLLMGKEYRISRSIRAQWFFQHLDKPVNAKPDDELVTSREELEVLSVLPEDSSSRCSDNEDEYHLVPSTKITFIGRQYRFVFCIDLSPSAATVDVDTGKVLIEEIYEDFSNCMHGLVEGFCVPGSNLCLKPDLYVTVMAHSTIIFKACQVLVQGYCATKDNVNDLVSEVCGKLHTFEDFLAEQLMKRYEQTLTTEAERGIHSSRSEYFNPEGGLFNMIRDGLLALQLLPDNASAGLIIITDGVFGFENASVVDAALAQMRANTVVCSFLQVGKGSQSSRHGFGYISHSALMQFLATATSGAYVVHCDKVTGRGERTDDYTDAPYVVCGKGMNKYHQALYCWNFQRDVDRDKIYAKAAQGKGFSPGNFRSEVIRSTVDPCLSVGSCLLPLQPLQRLKHSGGNLNAKISSVLSVRLREGYSIDKVAITKDGRQLEVKLILPWKEHVLIEYIAKAKWGEEEPENQTHFEVFIGGSYDFLIDVTRKQGIISPLRKLVVQKFEQTIKELRVTDDLLVRLQSFALNPIFYTIPDSARKGVPLFYLPPGSGTPVLSLQQGKSRNSPASQEAQFAVFWKPVLNLDTKVWQKWFHCHRISLLLANDWPLSRKLFIPSGTDHYTSVQCRLSVSVLHRFLRDWSSFVLLETYSYIRFMTRSSDRAPYSFCILRLVFKGLCVVLRLAFLGGTPGTERNQVVSDLKKELAALKVVGTKTMFSPEISPPDSPAKQKDSKAKAGTNERPCLVLLSKPLERMLIKYDAVPNFGHSSTDLRMPETAAQRSSSAMSESYDKRESVIPKRSSALLSMLSSYMYNQRWVWQMSSDNKTSLSHGAIANILFLLTQLRLFQGFQVCNSTNGIVTMVKEVQVEVLESGKSITQSELVVQFVLFPPRQQETLRLSHEESAESDVSQDNDGNFLMVTEIWIEPQYGSVVGEENLMVPLNGVAYNEIPAKMFPTDLQLVKELVTYSHLESMCVDKLLVTAPEERRKTNVTLSDFFVNSSTHEVSFPFDIPSLLEKSKQVLEFYPMLKETQVVGEEPGPNHLLIDLFHEALASLNDCATPLTKEESIATTRMAIARCSTLIKAHKTSDLMVIARLEEELLCSIQWRCYVRAYNGHLLITVVPLTFEDVEKIRAVRCNIDNADETEDNRDGAEDLLLSVTENYESDLSTPVLPVIIYQCDFASISAIPPQRLSFDDIIQDFTDTFSESTVTSSDLRKAYSSKTLGSFGKPGNLCSYCSSLYDRYFLTFVNAVFVCLRKGFVLDTQDVESSVEMICEETCIEVDISGLSKMLCSHWHTKGQEDSAQLGLDESHCKILCRKGKRTSSGSGSTKSSRTSTQTGLSCKHEDVQVFVKERFRKYLHLCFSAVPNNDNLLYYSIERDKNFFDDDVDSQASSEPEEDEFNRFAEADATTIIEIPKDFVSASLPEDLSELSLKSVKGSSNSDVDELENMSGNESEDLQNEMKPIPLFLLLTCSVKDKSNLGTTVTSFPIDTLPTCLGDVVKSLDSTGTLLNPRSPSLIVTLDLICLTLPQEVDSASLLKAEDSTSFVCDRSQEGLISGQSHNSEPEVFVQEFFALRKQQESSRAIFEGDEESSYIGTNIQMVDPIKNLPKYQQRAVRETVQKIEFLLEDEIASALRSVIPVTLSTLERVAKHISLSNADNCRSERIPLRFVFGLEKSLQLFLDRLEQLRLDSYYLKREGSYYYLTLALASRDVLAKSHESLFSGYGMTEVSGHTAESKTFEGILDSSENSTGAGKLKHTPNAALEHGKASYVVQEVTDAECSSRVEKDVVDLGDQCGTQELDVNDEQHILSYRVEDHQMSSDVTTSGLKSNAEDVEFRLNTPTTEETVQNIFNNEEVTLSASGRDVQDPLVKQTLPNHTVVEETGVGMESVLPMPEYKSNQRSRAGSPQGPRQFERMSEEVGMPRDTEESLGLEAANVHSCSSIHFPEAGDLEVSPGNLDDVTSDNTSTLNKTYSNIDLEQGVKDDLVLATRRDDFLSGTGFLAHRRQRSEPAIKFSDFVFSKERADDDEESVTQALIDDKSADLDFWLFLQLQNNEIQVFYHTRTMDSVEEDQRHEILYTKLIHTLEITCRVVNQMMLLNDLYETMTCHNLLVAEEDEQIWGLSREKSESKPILFTTHKQDKDIGMPFELGPVVHGEFEFRPGHFECDCVWSTHLPVHFRLKSSPGQQRGTSRGIQAVRAVLNRFSVTNRTNLFVFRESSGNVFYFRIFESIYVYDNLVPSTPNRPPVPDEDIVKEENLSLHSCASSMWSLTVRGYHEGTEDPELADAKLKRTSSFVNAGEKDSLSEHSLTGSSQVSDETIQFIVYGIAEPGREIKEDLIKVLQSRLDDATLEQLNLLLARNPKCRLAPADVHFIQPPAKPAIAALCFDIPAQVRPFTHSMVYYLRQNLLLKFHTPRFGEASPDFHFKNYSDDLSSCVSPEVFSSNDVYLYNKRGTKGIGIGCIHLSLIDAEGSDIVVPPKYPCPRYEVNNSDFFPMILKDMLDLKQVQKPFPDDENAMFLRFRVWGRGDIGVKDIKKCVSAAIRNAICDVFMEYFLLATSTGLVPPSQIHLLRFQSRSPSVSSQRSGGPNLKGLLTHSATQGNQRTWPVAIANETLTHKGRLSEPSTPASLTSRSPPFHSVERPAFVGLDVEHDSGRCTPDVDIFDRPVAGDVETPLSERRGIAHSPTSASIPVDGVKDGLVSVRRVSPSQEQRLQQKIPLVEQVPNTEEPISRATSPFDTLTDREVEESLKALNDQSDHAETKAKPDLRVTERKESTWQEIELQRRRESFRRKERRKFETGEVGELHPCFSSDAANTFELLLSENYVSLFKFEGVLDHSYCVDVVLKEVIKILVEICPDMKPKVFQKIQRLDDDGVDSFMPTFKFAPFSDRSALKVEEKCESSLDSSRQQLFFVPGHKCHYIILGRNMAQWRACMGICEENSEDEMDGPKAVAEESSKQRFKGLDPRCTSASLSKTPENCPPSSLQMAFVPRQKLFHVELHDRKLLMYSYNLSTDVTSSLEIQLSRLIAWHCARGHLQSCLFMQKLGLFHHMNFTSAKHASQDTASFCSSANHQHLVYLMKETAPPSRERFKAHENENVKVVTNTLMPTLDDMFYDTSPPRLLQNAGYRFVKDVVKRSGHQYQEVRNVRLSVNALNSKLHEVFETWQQRGSHIPISEDRLSLLKRQSRLVHFCSTPFLFTKPQYASEQDEKFKPGKGQGDSSKEEGKTSKGDKSKETIAERQNADQDSHDWLGELVKNFTQQYIKYLQTLGMCLIQLVPSSKGFGRDGGSRGRGAGKRSLPMKSGEETRPGMLYLQKTSPGGIILLELEFKESTFSVRIYGLESVRVKPLAWTVSIQDTLTFLDECAKFKDYAHLHSFSYDFHLRHVKQFLAGRHSILYPGYPVNRLLQYIRDEHPQPPHFACCLLGEGGVSVPCTPGLSTTEVYHYLTLNCKRHDLSVVKGKRIAANAGFQASDSLLSYMYTTNREQAAVDVRKVQANWRDGMDFDGTVVISHSTADDREVINIQYFVLLTSRRDFYPRLSLFGHTSSLKRLRKRAISGSESGSKLYVDDTALSGYPKPRVRFTMAASEPGRKTEFTVLDASGSTGPIRVPTWPGSFPSEIPNVPKTDEKLSSSGSETILSSSQQSVFTTAATKPQPSRGSPGSSVLKRSESADSDTPHGMVLVRESGMSGATITENYVTSDSRFLLEEISKVRRRLKDTVCSCLSNCWRDVIWYEILLGGEESSAKKAKRKAADGHRDSVNNGFLMKWEICKIISAVRTDACKIASFSSMKMLLELVTVFNFDKIDPRINMAFTLLQAQQKRTILRSVATRFSPHVRTFTSDDLQTTYLCILNPSHCDMFTLLISDEKGIVIRMVYRGKSSFRIAETCHFDELLSPDQEDVEHVEEVVSCLCFTIWSRLIRT